jgi:hypothetical protein
LAERDTKACNERLEELELQMERALEQMAAKDRKLEVHDTENTALEHTIYEVVRILGSFIQNNISSWVHTVHEPRTQEVLRIIADYSHHSDDASIPYVRLPESTISQYAQELQEAHGIVEEYRGVLHGQAAMISEQSNNLDDYTEKYEKAVRLVKERDHEVLLLAQRNDTLIGQLEDMEAALNQSQEANTQVEILGQRYEELRGNMESLKIAHELEIDQRDAEIDNLRQKLGTAREEIVARREHVRNILTQNQDPLQISERPEPLLRNSHASKALRFLGMERDKDRFRRGALPASRSMMGLTSSSRDVSPSSDPRYSTKELVSDVGRPVVQRVHSHDKHLHIQTAPNTPIDSLRGSGDSMLSSPAIRPRSDSLSATHRHAAPRSPVNTQKSLPAPPTQSQPSHQLTSAAGLTDSTSGPAQTPLKSPTAVQIASDYYQNSILGQTAARRVLSNIPEVSVDGPSEVDDQEDRSTDNDNESHDSLASSDREVFRKSICALDMLNSSSLPYSETETDLERVLRGGRRGAASSRDHHRAIVDDAQDRDVQTGIARVLHLRPGRHDLRGASTRPDHDADGEERARQSFVSDGSGYRTEDSEPQTVAQLYHEGERHIRG